MSAIAEITSSDWFINLKSLPDEESDEYADFWEHQRQLCIHGCTIEGEYFPGELYWHLNFWKLMRDEEVEIGGIKTIRDFVANPLLRDNEWIIFNEIRRAHIERKGLIILGSRRISKSTTLASYLCHGATLDEGSQNVLAGTSSEDIITLTNMMKRGLNELPHEFFWPKLEEKWDKQVTLGVHSKTNKKTAFSHLIIRNLSKGNNEESLAGLKPRRLVIDECGKNLWTAAYRAAEPGFTTRFGLACSPIISGTSGDMEKYQDAQEAFLDPRRFNFLEYPDEKDPRKVHGLFLGAKYRQEGKDESTLGEYLGKERDSDLHNIPMLVSNEDKAFKITDESLELLKGKKKEYAKQKMYFPKTVDDLFLSYSTNIFNKDTALAQKSRLEVDGIKGMPVELYQDVDGTVKWKHSDKEPITEFPLKTQSPDAPVIIWEHPIPNPPKMLYIFGMDPYRHANAKYSDSLGSIWIYKRIHSLTGEGFQDMFVAKYTARPDRKEDWNNTARLLIKYYNAYGLCENDELSFIDFMKGKNEAEIYLAPQPRFQSTLVKNSTVSRDFGVSRSSETVRNHLHSKLKSYLDDVIHRDVDSEGNVTKEILGVSRFFDAAFLEAASVYDGVMNADEIIAVECALALAGELDPIYGGMHKDNQDPRFTALFGGEKKQKRFKAYNGTKYRKRYFKPR